MQKDQSVYRHVLSDALRLAWQRRQLWIFGFFAMFMMTGGLIDTLMRALNDVSHKEVSQLYPGLSPALPEILGRIVPRGALLPPTWFLFVLFFLFLILGALIWFSVISQGALIAGIAAADAKANPRSALLRGMASFWPLLITNLVAKASLAGAALMTAAPLGMALTSASPAATLLSFLAFVLFIVLTMVVSVVSFYAIVDVVLTRSSTWHAIRNAIDTFRRHWIISIETALVLFGADVVMAVLFVSGFILILAPFTIFFVMMQVIGTISGTWFFLTGLTILLGVWTIAMASAATSFRYAVWTLLYERLQSRPVHAKIIRLLRAIPNFFSSSPS